MLDRTNIQDYNKMKLEAIHRFKWFDKVGDKLVKEFENNQKILVSDSTSSSYGLREITPEEENIVHTFEKEYGGLVYHLILTDTSFGRHLSMLYVSKYDEEWEYDKFENGCIFAQVENLTMPDCSEMGSIFIEVSDDMLKRLG